MFTNPDGTTDYVMFGLVIFFVVLMNIIIWVPLIWPEQ